MRYHLQHASLLFATPENEHHFFGYYDKSPFDATNTLLLGHSVAMDPLRDYTTGDTAAINLWDLTRGTKRQLATTNAFNFQQGSMLRWLGPDHASRIIYNDHRDGHYVSIVLDILTGREDIMPFPVYSVSGDGRHAVCANYERLYWCRPAYNYAHPGAARWNRPISADDGIFLLDLATKECSLIISTEKMTTIRPIASMFHGDNYLEHLHFSPDGEKFFFLHRWRTSDSGMLTRAYVANRDGSGINLLSDSGDISHYNWIDNDRMIITGSMTRSRISTMRRNPFLTRFVLPLLRPLVRRLIPQQGGLEKRLFNQTYFVVDTRTNAAEEIAPRTVFDTDGHPGVCPADPAVFVSDTYPRKDNMRELFLYNLEKKEKRNLGFFYSAPEQAGQSWSCDLHPRWDRSGKMVCIDTMHSGHRQMMVIAPEP